MDKQKSSYIIAIIALIFAVGAISIGFSAFSNVLEIKTSANVSPSAASFNVDFSSSSSAVETNSIVPTKTPSTIEATNATIDNTSAPTISNLSATFTGPGQKAVYEFYAYNAGEYKAFLNNITYGNVAGETSFKKCTASVGTTDALVQATCNFIVVKVKVGTESEVTGSQANITNHSIDKKTAEKVTVTIEYLPTENQADGDFTVDFGDITLGYSTID